MPRVPGHEGKTISIRYSVGEDRVAYMESWEDNVLAPPGVDGWPPALLKQVSSFVAPKKWFTDTDAEALAARLGRISKFQSINSEDAVTWSWFGTLGFAQAEDRRRAVQQLYDRAGLELRASPEVVVDQWMRVIHPNAPSRPGPQLDARIDDQGVALVYVEAKWDAVLGTGKGAVEGEEDDQVVLRRGALRAEPTLEDDHREFVVLGVSNDGPDLATYNETAQDPSLRPVRIAWLTWAELANCDAHPLAARFRAYLDWKRDLARSQAE